jgi:hypothetical protein
MTLRTQVATVLLSCTLAWPLALEARPKQRAERSGSAPATTLCQDYGTSMYHIATLRDSGRPASEVRGFLEHKDREDPFTAMMWVRLNTYLRLAYDYPTVPPHTLRQQVETLCAETETSPQLPTARTGNTSRY